MKLCDGGGDVAVMIAQFSKASRQTVAMQRTKPQSSA